MASPDHFTDMASPVVTPQMIATNGYYSSSDAVVTDAWRRYDASKRADADKNSLLEVRIFHCSNFTHVLSLWRSWTRAQSVEQRAILATFGRPKPIADYGPSVEECAYLR